MFSWSQLPFQFLTQKSSFTLYLYDVLICFSRQINVCLFNFYVEFFVEKEHRPKVDLIRLCVRVCVIYMYIDVGNFILIFTGNFYQRVHG